MRARSVARRITQPLSALISMELVATVECTDTVSGIAARSRQHRRTVERTAAVVTTPGPTTGQVAFRRESSARGRIGLDPRCHEGSCEGAMHQDGGAR